MKSNIWKANFERAFNEGYSINEIKTFYSEAELLLRQLINYFQTLDGTYSVLTKDKKVLAYLILNELINSLYDANEQLRIGNIRMASRVFRDIMENRHIIKLTQLSGGEKYIKKWFQNEIIQNRKYRDEIKKVDPELSKLTSEIYRRYSKFAHRSYYILLDSYTDKNGNLYYHRKLDLKNEIHRKIISRYYVHLAQFILNTGLDPLENELISDIRFGLIVNNLMNDK